MIEKINSFTEKIITHFFVKKDGKLEVLRIQNEIRLSNWRNIYYIFENENKSCNSVFVTIGDAYSFFITNIKKEVINSYIKMDKNAVVKYMNK